MASVGNIKGQENTVIVTGELSETVHVWDPAKRKHRVEPAFRDFEHPPAKETKGFYGLL